MTNETSIKYSNLCSVLLLLTIGLHHSWQHQWAEVDVIIRNTVAPPGGYSNQGALNIKVIFQGFDEDL